MAIGINLECEYCRNSSCNGKCGRDLEKESQERDTYLRKNIPDYEERKELLDNLIEKMKNDKNK